MFGAREKDFMLRENEKSEIWFAPQLYIENATRWIEVFVEDLLSTKSWQKWICRGVVEDFSMVKQRARSIKDLSSIYRADKEQGILAWWIKEAVEKLLSRQRVKKFSSIGLSKSYWAWRKGVSQGGKTHKDECNKQATQPKIQTTY